jgi:HlyD family secretion protein
MSKTSSRRRAVIIVLAALLLVVVGILILTRPKKAKYRTAPVQRGNISISVSATGTLYPVNQVTVGSQVSGTIEKTYFDYNDHVKAGQVLATIDPRNYQAAVQQAKANLASAQATLDQDKLTAARAETLFANGLMAYSDYLQAKTSAEVDGARLLQAQASYEQAQTNLAYTTITSPMSGIVVARKVDPGQTVAASFQAPELFNIADLSLMQVEVSIDEADVGKLDTGLIATFNVDAFPESTFSGKLVQVRNEPVTVSNVTTYIGIVRVQNPHMLLRPGMTANVKIIVNETDNVLTVPNAALNAKLASTLGFSGAGTARKPGRQFAGGGRDSLAGASGQATAGRGMQGAPGSGGRRQRRGFRAGAVAAESGRSRAPADTLVAPGRATPVAKTVFVLDNGRPVPRQVQVGLADATNTEIISGLSEGDLVITGLGRNGTAAATQNRGSPFGFGGPRGR